LPIWNLEFGIWNLEFGIWNLENVKEFANLVFLNCLGFVYFKELKSKIEFWL
jgi:hypothetical protein